MLQFSEFWEHQKRQLADDYEKAYYAREDTFSVCAGLNRSGFLSGQIYVNIPKDITEKEFDKVFEIFIDNLRSRIRDIFHPDEVLARKYETQMKLMSLKIEAEKRRREAEEIDYGQIPTYDQIKATALNRRSDVDEFGLSPDIISRCNTERLRSSNIPLQPSDLDSDVNRLSDKMFTTTILENPQNIRQKR